MVDKNGIIIKKYTKWQTKGYIATIYIKINRLNVHHYWFTTYFVKIRENFD